MYLYIDLHIDSSVIIYMVLTLMQLVANLANFLSATSAFGSKGAGVSKFADVLKVIHNYTIFFFCFSSHSPFLLMVDFVVLLLFNITLSFHTVLLMIIIITSSLI